MGKVVTGNLFLDQEKKGSSYLRNILKSEERII